MRAVLLVFLFGLLASGCVTDVREAAPEHVAVPLSFGDYWYQGEAEITTYRLQQARYGEVRAGEAVLIFVTEPFSLSRQVKLNRAGAAGDDEATVLKLNATRTFTTGVYPYSMMTSVFMPVGEGLMPLKVTTSSQEWCGQTFTQLNKTSRGWRARLFSYFESEGDQDLTLPEVMSEDGLWTLLRLDPARLPVGEVRLIPSLVHQRLSHRPMQPYAAKASLFSGGSLRVYTLTYPELDRSVRIHFQADFPFTIEEWEEEQLEGANGERLTTRAVRKERAMLDYWRRNSLADSTYRISLGLDRDS